MAGSTGPWSLSPFILCVALGIHHTSQGTLIIWALGTNGPRSLGQQIRGDPTCPEAAESLTHSTPQAWHAFSRAGPFPQTALRKAKVWTPVWGSVGWDSGLR